MLTRFSRNDFKLGIFFFEALYCSHLGFNGLLALLTFPRYEGGNEGSYFKEGGQASNCDNTFKKIVALIGFEGRIRLEVDNNNCTYVRYTVFNLLTFFAPRPP